MHPTRCFHMANHSPSPVVATIVHCIFRSIVDEGKGNIYYPGLASDIRVIAESYLVCRRKGMPEPSHQDLHIRFHFKMVEEWKTRRAAEGALQPSAPTAGIACGLGVAAGVAGIACGLGASGEGVSVGVAAGAGGPVGGLSTGDVAVDLACSLGTGGDPVTDVSGVPGA